MRCPGSGGIFTYGRPLPYHFLPRSAPRAMRGLHAGRALVAAQGLLDHPPYDPLLGRDVRARVDHPEVVLLCQLVVDVEHAALEDAEALRGIAREAEIHPGLVILELRAAAEEPLERHLDRDAEVEREIGARGEAVDGAQPRGVNAARHVAAEIGRAHV